MENNSLSPDLGLSEPIAHQLKSQLAAQIQADMNNRGMTQTQLAQLVGLDQPKVSKLQRGQLEDFSVRRLQEVLDRLGKSVQIIASEGWGVQPSIEIHVSDKIFSADIAIVQEEGAAVISNPVFSKLVFSQRQLKQFYAAIGTEIERYGQSLDSMEIIFTPEQDGKSSSDMHNITFRPTASSNFSPRGHLVDSDS